MLEQALKTAKGQARKALLKQKQELLAQSTGVDLSDPPPSPPHRLPSQPERTPQELAFDSLVMAQSTLKDCPEALSESMVTALVRAGVKLPASVRSKFAKLISELGDDKNPVPG